MENTYVPALTSMGEEKDDSYGENGPPKMDSLQLALVNCDLQGDDFTIHQVLKAPNQSHCLICNSSFDLLSENSQFYNVFGKLKSKEDVSKASIFEKIGQILEVSLSSIHLHSESICDRCLNLVVRYEEMEALLWTVRSEVLVKFEFTAQQHINSSSATSVIHKLDQGPEENINEVRAKTTEPCNKRKTKHKKVPGTNASNKRTPYPCTVCGKSFRAFSHRVEHMLIHLGEKPWQCNDCKQSFRTKSALRVHTMKHTGERPYSCPDCGKSFVDRYYYDEHCRVHTGERPFDCSFCGRLFARKKDLAIHKKSHTGDKPFKCTSCLKAFAVKSRLDRHSRTHTGYRPHPCEFCEKTFSRRDDYKVHLRQHTGERPFTCAVCKKTFSNKSNYLVHVRRHEVGDVATPPDDTFDSPLLDKSEAEKRIEAAEIEMQPVPLLQHHHLQAMHPQHIIGADAMQGFSAADMRSLQIPVGHVTQLAWNDGTSITTTNSYVNVSPGTYVNIVSDA